MNTLRHWINACSKLISHENPNRHLICSLKCSVGDRDLDRRSFLTSEMDSPPQHCCCLRWTVHEIDFYHFLEFFNTHVTPSQNRQKDFGRDLFLGFCIAPQKYIIIPKKIVLIVLEKNGLQWSVNCTLKDLKESSFLFNSTVCCARLQLSIEYNMTQ